MTTIMNRKQAWHHVVLTSVALVTSASACALDIKLPPETARFKESGLPGYKLVMENCLTCHSAHYIQTQPPTSPRTYWSATVKKMKKPFGAQFPDEDIPAMVDYLTKTYGAERTATASVNGK